LISSRYYSKITTDKLLNDAELHTRFLWIYIRRWRQPVIIVIAVVRIEYSRLAFMFAIFCHKRDNSFGYAAKSCLLPRKHPTLVWTCIRCSVSCFLVTSWNARACVGSAGTAIPPLSSRVMSSSTMASFWHTRDRQSAELLFLVE
jgi:hypothetical protein